MGYAKKGKKGLTKRERFDIINKLSREGEQKGRRPQKKLKDQEKSLDKSLKVWYSNKAVREGGGRKRRKRESHGEKDWKNLKKVLDKSLKLW